MANLNEIFSWFSIGKTPTADQFKQSWSSFWHKSEKVSMSAIFGLENSLNDKATKGDLQNLTGGLRNMGEVADQEALNAIPTPQDGDAYKVLSEKDENGNSYIFRYAVRKDENGVILSQGWVNTKLVAFDGEIATKEYVKDATMIIPVSEGVIVDNFYINLAGNPTPLNNWRYIKYRNNDLLKINIKGTAYGIASKTLCFYSSFDNISTETLISGYTFGNASTEGVDFDNELPIPKGTQCIVITDRANGNIQLYQASLSQWKQYNGVTDSGKYIIVDSGKYSDVNVKHLILEYTESKLTRNGYTRRADGVFVADTINLCSEPIEVGEEEFYVISELASDTVAGLSFFDADNNFISAPPKAVFYGQKITVQKPDNAKYYVIGRLKNGVNGINYDFYFCTYKTGKLTLQDDEVAFVSGNVVDKIVKVKDDSSQDKRFKLTDRNDNTFIGAMNTVLDAMLASKTGIKFVIESNFTEDLMSNGNGSGRKIIEFQRLLASYWGVQFIDISSKLGFVKRGTTNTLQYFMKDGTHPANYPDWDVIDGIPQFTAVNMIARYVANELKPIFSDWTGKRILYIGTSIPAGNPYEGNVKAQYPKIIADILGCQCDNKAVSGSVVRIKRVDGSLIPTAHSPFLSLNSSINYKNSLVNVIDNYDLVVFSHGRNDFQLDGTDFNIDNWNLTLS